jgi:GNAT superfamily N-acetyltransferase
MHDVPVPKNRLVRSLLDDGFRAGRVVPGSAESIAVRELVEQMFVRERKYLDTLGEDPWDAVSHYYLLTQNGRAVGGLRIVDPPNFSEAPDELPRRAGRYFLPMEEEFPLDGHVAATAEFFEAGRMVLLPDFRNKKAFVVLIATAYLYAVRWQKTGAVCAAAPETLGVYLKTGWQPLAEPYMSSRYHNPAHPLVVRTEQVPESYRALFLEIDACGLIEI